MVGGVSSYGFLDFEFDTVNENLVNSIDIGEDTLTSNPNEYYLFGNVSSPQLRNAVSGTIDSGNAITVSVVSTPVPFKLSPTLGLLMVGGIWGVNLLRKSRKSLAK